MQEKAAFLKGFIKGLSMDANSDCSKAIKEIVSCIADIAEEVDGLRERADYLVEEIFDIREALKLECDCECDDGCCCSVKCEKCGTENHFSHESIENCSCNCKCQNCGSDLNIDGCNCCDESCNHES
ncbi:MAG: hypothetical protein J6P21_03020 [Clostridia bacterium]|nr:hypothetical protein [Clostridia bacterium]